jgi:hypothetical protein
MRKPTLFIALACSVVMSFGFNLSKKIGKLEGEEYQHFMALRVYMDPPNARGERGKDDRKAFFKLKTRPERDEWLKEKGLWERFYKYEPHIRQKISEGDVQIGWDKHMVYMAWGRPYKRQKVAGRNAYRSERFTYRFEVRKDGAHQVWVRNSTDTYQAQKLYIKELIVDDDKVADIRSRDAKW